MFSLKKLVIVPLFALLLAPAAQAQYELPQAGGYAGLLGGFTKPDDIDGRFGYGAEVGLMLANGITFGGAFLSSSGNGLDLHHYGVTFDYRLTQVAVGLHGGAIVGATTAKASIGGSDTNFMVGPRLGYDFMIVEMFSLGADLSYLFTFGDDVGKTFNAFISAKYWF